MKQQKILLILSAFFMSPLLLVKSQDYYNIDAFGPNCGRANLQSYEQNQNGYNCMGGGDSPGRRSWRGRRDVEVTVPVAANSSTTIVAGESDDADEENEDIDEEALEAALAEGASRLSAGYTPEPSEFPSYVRVLSNWREGRGITGGSCGGTLVHKNIVLTAAHCQPPFSKQSTSYRIIANQNDRRTMAGSQSANVVATCMPSKSYGPEVPTGSATGFSYDFALLKLDRDLVYNENVQPACVDVQKPHKPEATCVITGYGIINNNQQTLNKKRALPMKQVRCPYGEPLNIACWESVNPQRYAGNICSGDSGSGMFCFNRCANRTRTVVVGQVSNAFVNSCVPGKVNMSQFVDLWQLRNVILNCLKTFRSMTGGNGIKWKLYR